MTPHDIAFAAKLGKELGPVALAVLYAVGAAGGTWAGRDADLAAVVGCSLRQLQIVRAGLVKADVLTYSSGGRDKPKTYRVKTPPGVAAGTPAEEALPVVPVPAKKGRKKKERDLTVWNPLFDAVCLMAGGLVQKTSGGRVAKLVDEMTDAGLTADRLTLELPVVVGKYAPHRETLDLNTITACWVWIITPPATVERNGKHAPSAFELAKRATQNGNPFKTEVTG